MDDRISVTRRSLLVSSAALTTALAGCSGNESAEPSDNSDEEETSGEEESSDPSEQEEEETSDDSTPSLSEFEYPEGATQDGIAGEQLYATHESTLTGAGSLTLTRDRTDVFDGNEFSETSSNKFDSNSIYREVEQSDGTEYIWAPESESVSYVQVESGFDQTYRIDNQQPDTNEVTGLRQFRQYLTATEWGGAEEIVETANGFAATYTSTGVRNPERINFGGEIDEYEASIAVTDSGFVTDLSFDLTVTFDGTTQGRRLTATVENVGETTVSEPDWGDTAREDGFQFDISLIEGGSAFEMELVNGGEVPSDTRIRLRSDQGDGGQRVPSALSVGDQLYLGLSDTNELLIDTEQVPDGVTQLNGRTTVRLRLSSRLLFEHVERL
ncbi:hypothetical protein [Halorubrum sp. F4]|uniref:DUF7537 family lipoprotein n=1 Tax=Halorubrum sp. F4 TaxID=2989715 RepID=UPI0024803E69|nr:hypothetical protein [Halorubrum sp. F4]